MRVISPHEKFGLLIVDGDRDARRLLEEAAVRSDRFWSIRTMADGRFALEHLWTSLEKGNGGPPDILIANPVLPGLNGIQLTRELRRHEQLRRLFVALLSSRATPLEQDAAENAGCDFYLRRSAQAEELVEVLHAIANRCGVKVSVPESLLS